MVWFEFLGFRFFSQVQENLGFSQKLMNRLAVHAYRQAITNVQQPFGWLCLAASWGPIGVHLVS